MNFKNILTIYKKEFYSYFISPIAYVVIAVFIIMIGIFFVTTFFYNNVASLEQFFYLIPITFSIIIPVITMRTFAEEFRTGSYEILATLPVGILDIISGKYLAALSFAMLCLVPTLSFPLFIVFYGDLDIGAVFTGYLGCLFISAAYCGIGILASSVSKNQIIAVIISMLVCFGLFMIDRLNVLYFIPTFLINLFQSLGTNYHFQNFENGVIDTRDVLYFLSLSFLSLYTTYFILKEKNR